MSISWLRDDLKHYHKLKLFWFGSGPVLLELAFIQAARIRQLQNPDHTAVLGSRWQIQNETLPNFLDTADMYGPHTNEVLVGRALKGKRAKFVLATKFGIQFDPDHPEHRSLSGKPEYVKSACEASLGRLGIDTIDDEVFPKDAASGLRYPEEMMTSVHA